MVKRMLTALLCLLLFSAVMPQVLAVHGVDLIIRQNCGCADTVFQIYQVATIDANGIYRFMQSESFSLVAEAASDSNGCLTFPNLPRGVLYMVCGNTHTAEDGDTHEPMSFEIPILEDSPDTVHADVKFVSTSGPTTFHSVIKLWDDDLDTHPEVTVNLIRVDSSNNIRSIQDTVTLSDENHWTHTWEELDSQYDWYAEEINTPSGYMSFEAYVSNIAVITNSPIVWPDDDPNDPDAPDTPDTPDDPDTPDFPDTPGNPDNPDTPDTPGTPDTPDMPDSPDTPGTPETSGDPVPQTGILWWPIPILALCGTCAFLAGWFFHHRSRGDRSA